MEHTDTSPRSKLVICIEDEPDVVTLIRLILRTAGFEVIGAPNGKEGLAKMRERKPDLVLLDLMMPEMNGWEVYWLMKGDETLKDIPVIVVTVKSGLVNQRLAMQVAQVEGYITKPFRAQELLLDVKRVLGMEIR